MDFFGNDDNEDIENKEEDNNKFNVLSLKFAPVWKRMIAYTIDILMLWIIVSIMIGIVYYKDIESIGNQENVQTIYKMMEAFISINGINVTIVSFLIETAYFMLCWINNGQTIGAMIMKIAVVDIFNLKMGILQSVLRYFIIALSARLFFVPLIFVFNPVYKQRIMDFFARTVVVEMPEKDATNSNI